MIQDSSGAHNPESIDNVWAFAYSLWQDGGAIVLLLAFVCLIFYKLIWKVWDNAMRAKNQEIERLVEQRDKYQSLFFERIESSDPTKEVEESAPLARPEGK